MGQLFLFAWVTLVAVYIWRKIFIGYKIEIDFTKNIQA